MEEEDPIVDQVMDEGGDDAPHEEDQDQAAQEEKSDVRSGSPSKLDDDMAIDEHRLAHHPAPSSLPVDPNEPMYCVCNQVSFGEMIAVSSMRV